ncbi:GNAT family N-acetyltransferase [Pseudalkalibacillus decolorationis]|uniref:GNAT family N-acetyltransferase n=1 Tax=Pseudalkalibacillus decolorationis TaxID=163879 RepID=UPI0021481DA4|nr:GNAT family protein [Pseudalkalibacillus decolorationis]
MKKLEIETPRLIIKPLETEDYQNWLTQHENRLPSQYKYDNGKSDMSECTEQWFIAMVENHQQSALSDRDYIFGVFHKKDGDHLGSVDISTLIRYDFQWGRIGYTIHNQFWRQGYGKESLNGALELAFRQLNFHRIEAHINVDNIASINLAESVGMKYECTRKGFIYEFGEWTDNLVYYINNGG